MCPEPYSGHVSNSAPGQPHSIFLYSGTQDEDDLPGALALAVELLRVLFADAAMLARVRGAAVHHQAGVEREVVPGRKLVTGPVDGRPEISVDRDLLHAADEASVAVDAAADHVVDAGRKVEKSSGLSPVVVDNQQSIVLGHRELQGVPLPVVVDLVKVVDFYARYTLSRNSDLDSTLLDGQGHEPVAGEGVVDQEAALLVGPEVEADVQVLGSFAASEPDEGLVGLEGDRHDRLVNRAAFDDAADNF